MKNSDLTHKLHLALGITSIVVMVIFTLQNAEVISVRFLFWTLEMSRVILILVLLLIGFLSGYIFHGIQKRLS